MALKIKYIAIGAFVSLVFYASGMLAILTPLPLLYVFVSRGRREGILSAMLAVAAVVFVYLFIFPGMASSAEKTSFPIPIPGMGMTGYFVSNFLSMLGIGYYVFFVAIALALGEGVRRKWSLTKLGILALVAAFAVILAIVISAELINGTEILSSIKNYLNLVLSEVIKMNQSANTTNAGLGFLASNADKLVSLMMGLAPSFIFAFAVLAVVVNLLLGRRFIRGHHAFAHVHNTARFRLPDVVVWVVIASGAMFFLNRYMVHRDWFEMIAINGLIALGVLYFFQGLAVVVYYLQGLRFPLFRTLAYLAIILFFQTAGIMIVAVGLADVWADFRLRSWRAKHSSQE